MSMCFGTRYWALGIGYWYWALRLGLEIPDD